jgi:hypothetical protein
MTLVKLANSKQQTERLLRQANEEVDEVNRQLDENEAIKLGQFAQLEKKDRDINALKGLCRKLIGLIEAHREVFGDIDTINYEKVFADVEREVDLSY